jgi:hypothetical protein
LRYWPLANIRKQSLTSGKALPYISASFCGSDSPANAGFCVQKPRLPLSTICRQAAKDSMVQSSSTRPAPVFIYAPGPLVRVTCAEHCVEGTTCRCRAGAQANCGENNQSCQKRHAQKGLSTISVGAERPIATTIAQQRPPAKYQRSLLAQSGHSSVADQCPLSGVKRT